MPGLTNTNWFKNGKEHFNISFSTSTEQINNLWPFLALTCKFSCLGQIYFFNFICILQYKMMRQFFSCHSTEKRILEVHQPRKIFLKKIFAHDDRKSWELSLYVEIKNPQRITKFSEELEIPNFKGNLQMPDHTWLLPTKKNRNSNVIFLSLQI